MNQFSQESLSGMPGSALSEPAASIGIAEALRASKATPGHLSNVWDILTHSKKVLAGSIIVAFFILVAVLSPLIVHGDPATVTEDILQPPSVTHLLGTTDQGQDVFAQLVVGTRASIFWGLLTGLLVTALSVVVGLAGGYAGGVLDEILSLLSNVFLILPGLPLAIILAAYFPVKGDVTIAFVIIVTSWSWQARVLRAQTLSMRHRDFVIASRVLGESAWRIIFYEIFPNELAIIVAGFISTVIYVILAAAGLEFLGLGNPASVSWGTMFYWAQSDGALVVGAWWWFLPPGISIALLGVALALINFGIDEIANPRLKTRFTKKLRAKKAVAS